MRKCADEVRVVSTFADMESWLDDMQTGGESAPVHTVPATVSVVDTISPAPLTDTMRRSHSHALRETYANEHKKRVSM